MRVLAIDPGLRACGVANFVDGVLDEASYLKADRVEGDGPDAWREMVATIDHMYVPPDLLVFEQPGAYKSDTARRTLDLQGLIGVCGFMCGKWQMEAIRYRPREWKGTIPDEMINERIKSRLSESELGRVILPAKSYQHNVWNAIGVGLKYLNRLERKRNYHGGND